MKRVHPRKGKSKARKQSKMESGEALSIDLRVSGATGSTIDVES